MLGDVWNLQKSPANYDWRSVAFGNGVFVALARQLITNAAAISYDGLSWTLVTLPAKRKWGAICFADGKFVAVAYDTDLNNKVMVSVDGLNWTIAQSADDSRKWTTITHGAGKFVALSSNGEAEDNNCCMTSPDGINWTSQATPPNNWWSDITFGAGLFMGVAQWGSGERIMYSTDAVTWIESTNPGDFEWDAVAYGKGLYVCLGDNTTACITSPDGLVWTPRTVPTIAWSSLIFTGTMFVAVAYDYVVSGEYIYTNVITSLDGINWNYIKSPALNNWMAVNYGAGTLVAVARSGENNRFMTSVDDSIVGAYKKPVQRFVDLEIDKTI